MRMFYVVFMMAAMAASPPLLWATDWDEIQAQNPAVGGVDSEGPRTCAADFVVTGYPYHNETTLIGAGNDCFVRSGQDHIYQVIIATPGEYTLSLCESPQNVNTQIYLKLGCCSGNNVATNDDGCGLGSGLSRIDCVYLTVGTYWLIVEPRNAGNEGPYALDISSCSNSCLQAFRIDGVFDNGDGTFTYVQTTDENDTGTNLYGGPFPAAENPCVSGMTYSGFDIYSWYDQDYGWRHEWPGYNAEGGVCVQSVQIVMCAYDVDQADCSELHPNSPQSCELDHLFADGVLLNPNYLQGTDGDWSITVFDVSPSALLADGALDVFMDIDVWNSTCTWATTVNWSQLVVRYRSSNCNQPPFTPLLSGDQCYTPDIDLCVSVTGPDPADPDGDAVSYQYRWFVQNSQTNNGFVDDELNPLHPVDHSGSCIPASDTEIGDEWLVQVIAVDAHGTACVDHATLYFPVVIAGPCGPQDPVVYDLGDLAVVECPEGYPLDRAINGGPAHPVAVSNRAWLGATVTAEDVPAAPDGDSGDDGVAFVATPWLPCTEVCVSITVTTGPGYEGQAMYIYGWKDGNLDCDWNDVLCDGGASECIIGGALVPFMQANSSQVLQYCFSDPGVFDIGHYDGRLRFRLMSTNPGCAAAQSGVDALLGEVEDYVITDLQLAVELLAFGANVVSGSSGLPEVELVWSTATEQANDHFDIERSDGNSWTTVGRVKGAGTSGTTHEYEYVDSGIMIGSTYTYRLTSVAVNGEREVLQEKSIVVTSALPDAAVVDEYKLYANYPNPFNPSTTIVYDLKAASDVKLVVFDVLGREIATLQRGYQSSGRHRVEFDASGMATGLYLYRLETPEYSEIRKMMLLK